MNLKIGDQVFVTDDHLKGEVISFTENEVTFVCNDGFDYTYSIDLIFKLNEEGEVENKVITKNDIFVPETRISKEGNNSFQLQLDFSNNIFDLHIEVLNKSMCNLSNYEILEFQMEVVREILFQANRKRIRKLIFVHGVGEGKLRQAIREYLKKAHTEVEFLDANYQKYGGGATEVIIHQFDSID